MLVAPAEAAGRPRRSSRRSTSARTGQRFEYRLTEKGEALLPLLTAMRDWSDEWVFGRGHEPVIVKDRRTHRRIPKLRVTRRRRAMRDAPRPAHRARPGRVERRSCACWGRAAAPYGDHSPAAARTPAASCALTSKGALPDGQHTHRSSKIAGSEGQGRRAGGAAGGAGRRRAGRAGVPGLSRPPLDTGPEAASCSTKRTRTTRPSSCTARRRTWPRIASAARRKG